MENFDLAAYLTGGVEKIVKNILRATLKDPRESAFMLKYSAASREASKRRAASEKAEEHSESEKCALIDRSETIGIYSLYPPRFIIIVQRKTAFYK